MDYRENIRKHLLQILDKNFEDGSTYSIAAENSKRLLFKNFFRKLSHQKRSFCKRIKYEIEVVENEIIMVGRESDALRKWKSPQISGLPVFRVESNGLIAECYRREKKNIEMYNTLLSKISSGQIREMLLFQKHSVQLILQEIESMGIKVYRGVEDGKNAGEKNYF